MIFETKSVALNRSSAITSILRGYSIKNRVIFSIQCDIEPRCQKLYIVTREKNVDRYSPVFNTL